MTSTAVLVVGEARISGSSLGWHTFIGRRSGSVRPATAADST
jgi:hypothetical protein